MSIKKMEYDNWINSLSNDTEIENPTWEQVEKAIKSLDADQHTMVILTSVFPQFSFMESAGFFHEHRRRRISRIHNFKMKGK